MQAQGAKKGAALLEKLDELSATMDRGLAMLNLTSAGIRHMKGTTVPQASPRPGTLGKSSALKTPAPVGGRSLKPPGPENAMMHLLVYPGSRRHWERRKEVI